MSRNGRLTWNNRDDTDARKYFEAVEAAFDTEKARAEKAEHVAKERAATIKEQAALIDALRAEQPRPLTARENLAALWESAHRPVGGRIPAGTAIITRSDHGNGDVRYQTLEATGRDLPDEGRTLERNYPYGPENGEEYRLLDPPTRPEGAEELDELVDRSIRGCSDITSPEIVRAISDGLAESVVRVTGAES